MLRFLVPLLFALVALPASAATLNITGSVTTGAAAGEFGQGTVTFDETLLTGVGVEFLDPADGISINFTIFGQTFTSANDVFFPDRPSLGFDNGELAFVDFLVTEVAVDPTDLLTAIADPRILEFSLFSVTGIPGGFGGDVAVTYAAIPLPASLPLLLAGLGAFAVLLRRSA